nr:retrovirus-related Pol polyprotein from transposon TNT 1-94 [Tanacetum cinerariifolium]
GTYTASGNSLLVVGMPCAFYSQQFYHTEQKMALGYQNPFYLKQAQQKQESLYDGKVLFEKHDHLVVHDSEETLQLAQETDESLAKHKALELEIEHLLRAAVSQDIMFVVQNNSIVDTSNLQTELERMKERFENRIFKKENEYYKLWNDWYKKCEECKYDKISYDKAYNDMQQKIEWLQAQLGNLKGKSKDTSRVSDTLDTLSQKLENKNVEVEFQIGETHALSKPVTSNSLPTPQESKVVKNDKVIDPGMFRINPFKPSREEQHVRNKVRASIRTNPITVSQPLVITKKVVNFDSNGLSSTGVDNTKTRRPQPRSNTKNDRVPFMSKSSRSKNKEVEVEEHHRKLLLSKNKKHMSSECNNVKLATQNVKSKVVCAMCKQCLISVNHDVCLLHYVNGMNSRGKKQKANVSINENQKKQKPKVKKTKKVGFYERLASPKPSKPRSVLRWSPTRRFFNLKGNIIAINESKSQSDCSKGDTACTSNPLEPTIKRFPNSTFSLAGYPNMFMGNILITMVYFIEGLGHNLFSVGQFCDSELEVQFLRSKDEAPEVIKTFLKRITILLQSHVIIIRTDNGSEFKNQVLKEYFDSVGISHQVSSIRTPQQNGVVERRNRMLVQAARTMLIFSQPLFLWDEVIATVCFTQNHSIINRRFNKTPYELIDGRKPDISFLHVFGALGYPKNNREDIGKLGAKGDIGFFIGYSADSCADRVYNRRTKKIMETMNVTFNELSVMAFEQCSLKPELQSMTSGQLSSGLVLTYAPSTITNQQPTEGELDLLFEAMYDDYIGGQPSATPRTVSAAQDHPLEQVIGELSRPVLTRNQLRSDGDMGMYALTFKRLDIWVLVPAPDNITPLTLKWLFKNKHDEEKTVIRNKSRLVDADHPIHAFKLKKALNGLNQAPRACLSPHELDRLAKS